MTQRERQIPDIDKLLSGDSDQLRQLLTGCFVCAEPGTIDPTALAQQLSAQPLECDRPLISSIQNNLPADQSLDSASYALVTFIDQLFSNYHKNNHLHPDIRPAINHFRQPSLMNLCRGELPWNNDSSPLKFLPTLIPHLFGWHPELGRAAEKFLNSFSPLISAVAHAADEDSLAEAHDALQHFFKQEKERTDKLERRLRDAEMGQLHARHAQQLSAKTLNQQMGGKKLPSSISRFLQGPWRESMRLTLINDGHESEQWRLLLRLTETLIWSVQPLESDAPPDKRQHIYDSISELSDQLRDIVLRHPDENTEAALSDIEAEHLKILKGETLDYQPFDLIDNTNPLLNAKVTISNNLIKNVNKYPEGHWFTYHHDDGDKRIKLVLKIDSVQQLLFTNFLGIKAEQFSIEEFAFMLSSKIVEPLIPRDIFRATGEKMLQSLLRHYQAQQHIEPADSEREQEVARAQAREKALQEAQTHEPTAPEPEQQENIAPPPVQEAEIQAEHVPSEEIRTQVDALMLGAVVTFRNESGEESSCRLAAILKHTGDYIFVNKLGLKEHVLKYEQLTAGIANSSVRVVNQGSDIKGTLEEVVNNFRTRK